ncbi:serine/threonine-protein phosphatase 6 regulatory ankyrin repeat subunit B-like [Pecten maximus]|uniref:serine/threonine-protein phosphatase 6 regulatory ankyrin repeat subunit B-like n=1 Tax=Pecten maximus TaxID=6579 RepID=UPI00145848DD|nr:serine/threonine-protein phosphatase 6 regulatory ankyrin repeat subunit B-like [Pecten maximus]
MQDLCDGYEQRMKQHEEIMSSIKEKENIDQTEQRNIISQTENWVQEQRSTFQFVTTKAFDCAKEKIKEKRFVVIRGDSGSGKTRLATELLDWLHSPAQIHAFNCKKPLRLPSLQRWDKVISANANLSILLDDLLGYSSEVSQDLTWWKQHGEMLNSIVVGKESANHLIITLRNDIYNEYKSKFDCLSLFDDGHVIDLSSPEYILREERETLLTTYTQTIDNFKPFSEIEINQITAVSPPIGFPECCRIFRKTPDLHPERVEYFRKPFQSIRSVITEKFNRAKQTALIYILLSREPVSTNLLDFESECFDKEGITRAFSVSSHVFPDSKHITADIATQLPCLQEGLDVLCDSFVRKEKGIYKFFHDSIQDVIAILYGKKTPRGFLNNCPSSCLHYVATSECKDILHKVVIEKDNYEIAYQRIVRELESKQHSSYIAVSSMSSWNNEEFLIGFFNWLKSEKYSTEDYFIRLETGEPLMLSDNRLIPFMDIAKKREDTSSCFLIYAAKMNSINLISHFTKRLDILDLTNHMKYALDVALSEGSFECSTYLLHKNIEPDGTSCFCAAIGGNIEIMKILDKLLKKLTDSEKWDILCAACVVGQHEMCAYILEISPNLLSRRDKNSNDHLLHIIAKTESIDCFRIVANLFIQECQSNEEIKQSIKALTNQNGSTVLHLAFQSKQRIMIVYLMKQYPYLLTQKNPNSVNDLSSTAMSCKLGILTVKDIERVIKSICQNGMMESLIDENGDSILHWMCKCGNEEVCVKLLPICPPYFQKNHKGLSCLHCMILAGKIECFKSAAAFMIKGKNKEESDKIMTDNNLGFTLLHLACNGGHTHICLYLIGECPRLFHIKDQFDHHCLHLVAQSGNVKCFQSIADLALKNMNKTQKEIFMESLKDKYGTTVLYHACLKGNKDICLYLIKEYPRLIYKKDRFDRHCLHLIARSGNVECFQSIYDIALKDINETEKGIFMERLLDNDGWTVLHHACLTGNKDICLYLIGEYPRLLSKKNRCEQHCLHLVAESGNVECFQSIADLALKDMNETEKEIFMESLLDNYGWTVLHHACLKGNKDICLYLIGEYPRLLSKKDRREQHCLHLVAESGNVECFQSIADLALKDMNETEKEIFMESLLDIDGWTVLHQACLKGNKDICLYLIGEYPRLLSKKDRREQHCLHLVAKSGNVECFQSIADLALKDMNETEKEIFMESLLDIDGWTVLHHACLKETKISACT